MMKLTIKYAFIVLYLQSMFVAAADFDKWVWKDIEVVGHNKLTREQITQFIPLEVGAKYKHEKEKWDAWCAQVKAYLILHHASCSALLYSDFSAYLVVDIIEQQDAARTNFREPPQKEIDFVPAEIIAAHEELMNRVWELFKAGNPPIENYENGFKDYDDPKAHQLSLKLQRLVPKYRENILDTLENDLYEQKRVMAADLLNWADNTSDSISRVHRLLNDPSYTVRNDISRFMMSFVAKVPDKSLLPGVIDSLVVQLEYPSHGDRNKALYALLAIADNFQELHEYLRKTGQGPIERIAEQSILSNVGSVADDLKKKLSLK